MHPSIAEALADLDFRHLPDHLRGVSMRFAALGAELAAMGGGAKITRALHHLRAAKDLAVQAVAAPGRDDLEVVGAMLAALAEQADKLDADPCPGCGAPHENGPAEPCGDCAEQATAEPGPEPGPEPATPADVARAAWSSGEDDEKSVIDALLRAFPMQPKAARKIARSTRPR